MEDINIKLIPPSKVEELDNGRHIIKSWLNKDEQLNSFQDNPAKVRYREGEKIHEYWYKDGKLHRDGDLPAEIKYEDGKIVMEKWYKNGEEFRDNNKPTEISYSSMFRREIRIKKGKLHNDEDIPSYIIYDTDNKIVVEKWYKEGDEHRDGDKPAYISYDENGEIVQKKYFKEGKLIK